MEPVKVRKGFVFCFKHFFFFILSTMFVLQAGFLQMEGKKISVPLILPSLLSPFRLLLPKVIIFNENSQP